MIMGISEYMEVPTAHDHENTDSAGGAGDTGVAAEVFPAVPAKRSRPVRTGSTT
jgi:hypothetical protein